MEGCNDYILKTDVMFPERMAIKKAASFKKYEEKEKIQRLI